MANVFKIIEPNSTAADNNDINQIAIDDLYPALVQCFGTIACG